ncbi:SH3 domain-containing protein [Jannaschia sp. Os4]|uniref:SH3 domain-containing protein n=1 Tax=Jannaschia sp. Os4 TaxID=2807617 RepID=UPI001939FED2|nr:SH3 domain-containing protein [Jannaschia sp. Os4]MBM2577174.1 SH3 domain-containing protein [Jannaschia sp. Os4]
MFKWVFTLAAGLYAGFVIYGQPVDGLGEANAALPVAAATTAQDAQDRPVILTAQPSAPAVTRAEPDTALLAAASTASGATFSTQPRLVGEPVTVSLVQPAAAPAETPAALDATGPLVRVTGSRVNMRSGPGVANGVVDSLPRGTVAEAIGEPVSGWQEIRDVESGLTGFMSSNFLEPA